MLFDGFATANEVQRRKAGVDSQAHALQATAERTALEVVEAYLDVLRREELVRIANDNLRAHQRVYDQIRLRSERGVGSASDRDQADARLAQARNNLTTERTNLADAQVNFFSVGSAVIRKTCPCRRGYPAICRPAWSRRVCA